MAPTPAERPTPPACLFASDNAAGVHPAVIESLVEANAGHTLAYGADPWTKRATASFRDLLTPDIEVLFTWGGTGANVVGLQCLLAPWQGVICPDSAHIAVDECGAPERFTGCKLLTVPTPDGKLVPDQITDHLHALGDEHHVQPAVVSITQSTEMGTLYTADQVAAICDTAHANGLTVHMDGARIANAVAATAGTGATHDEGVSALRRLLVETGVDVLSFGGTKNGMMYGEAVVFLRPELGRNAKFVRKQGGQLPSKMRYVAAQFEALLANGLWIDNAANANAMATRLAARLATVEGVDVQGEPAVNAVFATLPHDLIAPLQDWAFFWVWDQAEALVRWMCSFDTTTDDVDRFADGVAWFIRQSTPR